MTDETEPAAAGSSAGQPEGTAGGAHYRRLVETAPEMIFAVDAAGRFTELNPAGERTLGVASGALIGSHFVTVVDPDHHEAAHELFGGLVGGQMTHVDADISIRRPTGERRLLRVTATVVRQEDGTMVGAHGVARDVTAEYRDRTELARAHAQLAHVLATSPTVLYSLNVDSSGATPKWVSDNIRDVFGYDVEEALVPGWWYNGVHPDDRARAAGFMGGIHGEGSYSHQYRFRHRDGSWCWVDDQMRVTDALNGDTLVISGSWTDITARRASQHQLQLLAAALEELDEGISISDESGQVLYSNSTHTRLAAAEQASLFAEPDADSTADVQLERISTRVNVPGHGGVVFEVTRDVRQRLKNEQHLRRAERLASVGQLIGGVAHELNNPLQTIGAFSAELLREERSPEERRDLETILREAQRAARIVANLRTLARGTQEDPTVRAAVDLNEVVRHVIRTRRYTLDTRNVSVVDQLAGDLPPIWADRSQIEQVLLNLVINAEQALADTAACRLTLRTRLQGDEVVLDVIDNGSGIAPADMERIFDPFFTTKPAGEGTGLGLPMVHGIITDHGGAIHVDSARGRGTRFTIRLPRAVNVTAADVPAPALLPVPVRPLRILVVDDEREIRRVFARFLTRRGHTVLTAAEGDEALRLLVVQDTAEQFDVIVSDLRMPGLGGDQLLLRLRSHGCGLDRRVIFVTGDAAGGDAARILAESNAPVIYKPVELDEFARQVEQHAEHAHN